MFGDLYVNENVQENEGAPRGQSSRSSQDVDLLTVSHVDVVELGTDLESLKEICHEFTGECSALQPLPSFPFISTTYFLSTYIDIHL